MKIFLVVLSLAVLVVLPAIESAKGTNNTPTKKSRPEFSCLAGRPGIPGLHGKPGAPGRDGRDGREGIQGKQGPRGFDGTPGKQGTLEAAGSIGPPGPRGFQGAEGDTGPKGEPGTRGLSSYSNWKECSWNAIGESEDNGMIKDCIFQKKYNDSILHVYWNGDFRIYNCDDCCKRWFFTFNGTECLGPRAIDGVLYLWKGAGTQNLHRVRHIEGHCDKISKGHVRVGFNVGDCSGGVRSADAHTGWNSNSRLFVEEVPRPQE